jgi:hypothetical protein
MIIKTKITQINHATRKIVHIEINLRNSVKIPIHRISKKEFCVICVKKRNVGAQHLEPCKDPSGISRRDAATWRISFVSSFYQPYAAMRRSISFLHLSAKNLMPLCGEGITFCLLLSTNFMPLRGEAFHFCTYLLRTLCRYAAKHFIFALIC